MKPSAGAPPPVDMHVGASLRERRKELGLSQGDIGQAIGCTFPHVQKYEHGANRVSASALWSFVGKLGVEVGYLFEELQR